ncbi:hypothetical protein COBT_003863, partial [Conglomerata obtusa]
MFAKTIDSKNTTIKDKLMQFEYTENHDKNYLYILSDDQENCINDNNEYNKKCNGINYPVNNKNQDIISNKMHGQNNNSISNKSNKQITLERENKNFQKISLNNKNDKPIIVIDETKNFPIFTKNNGKQIENDQKSNVYLINCDDSKNSISDKQSFLCDVKNSEIMTNKSKVNTHKSKIAKYSLNDEYFIKNYLILDKKILDDKNILDLFLNFIIIQEIKEIDIFYIKYNINNKIINNDILKESFEDLQMKM